MSLKACEENCFNCQWWRFYMASPEDLPSCKAVRFAGRPCPLDTRRCYPGGGKMAKGERIDPDVVLDTKRMDWVCPNRQVAKGEKS